MRSVVGRNQHITGRGGAGAARCWRFGTAQLDEADWTLRVAGARVALERKPLQILSELLQRAGEVVAKDDLLDRVWPDVIVVEGSLPTAISKLRAALGDSNRQLIETVPGIGYRLNARPSLDSPEAPAEPASPPLPEPPQRGGQWQNWRVPAIATGLAAGLAATLVLFSARLLPTLGPVSQAEAAQALKALDLVAVHQLADRGWSPLTPFDAQRNDALNLVINVCEWNPEHDRRRLQEMVWLLINLGARPDIRNVWGDTAYSIARSPRYCGPDHPATRQLRVACSDRSGQLRPACLPDYAHSEWPQDPRLAPLPRVPD